MKLLSGSLERLKVPRRMEERVVTSCTSLSGELRKHGRPDNLTGSINRKGFCFPERFVSLIVSLNVMFKLGTSSHCYNLVL